MADRKENSLLDILKFIAAVMITASHCLPLVPNDSFNFYYGQWFFRFCVPLYFISSGFFFSSFQEEMRSTYIKRISAIYLLSTLLYIPVFKTEGLTSIIRTSILGYHHLWYLSALLIALMICHICTKIPFIDKIYNRVYPWMALVLIIIGAYFDEYQYAFTSLNDIPFIVFANKAIQFIGGSRHALFFALPMILIGKFLEEHKIFFNASKTTCVTLLIVSFFVSLVECIILRYYGGEDITCDITLFNYIPAVFLFILTFLHQPKAFSGTSTRTLRKAADVLYISHVLILHAVDKVFEVEYLLRFLLVLVASLIVSSLYVCLERTKEKSSKR